jgi:biofilm PGA synthesis protein PgaD
MQVPKKSEQKNLLRKVTELSVTALIWGFWVYLFLPLLSVILWFLGIKIFTVAVIEHTGYLEFLVLVKTLGWYILTLFLILRLWGYYNYWRFGKKNRRKSSAPDGAATQELADYFRMQVSAVQELRSLKEVVWPLRENPGEDVVSWLSRSRDTHPPTNREDISPAE